MECRACGCLMVPKNRPKPVGVRKHTGRGLCSACYRRSWLTDTLDQYPVSIRIGILHKPPHSTDDCEFCADTRWLADGGTPEHEWADRLGTSVGALAMRLYRHGQTDLANRAERVRAAQRRALGEVV